MNYEQTIRSIFNHLVTQHPELTQNLPCPEVSLTEQTSIEIYGDYSGSDLARCVQLAFQRTLGLQHKLPEWIVKMDGMSGRKYRYFINNLIEILTAPKYLEVGSWAGSTACSAIYGNSLDVTCVDDWSDFGGPKDRFLENIAKTKGSGCNFRFIESDFRKIKWAQIEYAANVYLFDGPHAEQDQYDGIYMALPALQDNFVLIVDDYNWLPVQSGTVRALNDFGLRVNYGIKILTTTNHAHPTRNAGPNSDWHNGYFIGVVSK
jgi:hypothetical protein